MFDIPLIVFVIILGLVLLIVVRRLLRMADDD